MPGAYSADLRQRVLRVCECGQVSRAKIAALFQVGETTLYRWQQEWRAEGRCRAKPHAGGLVVQFQHFVPMVSGRSVPASWERRPQPMNGAGTLAYDLYH